MANGNKHLERGGRRSIASMAWACALPLCAAPGCLFGDYEDDDGDDPSGVADDGEVPEPEPQPEPLQEEPFTQPCVPDAWLAEMDASADAGVPTSFDLAGTQIRIVVDAPAEIASVPAPLSIAVSPNGGEPLVVFADASVDGEPAGTVVIVGATIQADAGAFAELQVTSAAFGETTMQVALVASTDDGMRPQLGATADPAHVAALADAEPVDVRVDALRIAAYTSAYVVTPEGNVPLAGPFEIAAARLFWPHGTEILADAVDARFAGDVVIGLEPLSGELSAAGEIADELPIAILGRDAHLLVGPTRVRTVEDMPVHQAMGREDVLLASEVELRMCHAPTLVFNAGQRRKLRLAYRQPAGLTDAVFTDVVVADAAGTLWETRIEIDPTLPDALATAAEEHPDTSWGGALVGFVEAWAEAVAAITEGLICVFTFGFLCPDDDGASTPDPLLDYPGWMEAAAVGEFELEIVAPAVAGTYEVTVTITGENYEATVPTIVVVR